MLIAVRAGVCIMGSHDLYVVCRYNMWVEFHPRHAALKFDLHEVASFSSRNRIRRRHKTLKYCTASI